MGSTSRRSSRLPAAPGRRSSAASPPSTPTRSTSTSPPRSTTRRSSATLTATSTADVARYTRSEEHTSELQSQSNLVCRLLLEKKKTHTSSGDRGPHVSRTELEHEDI